MLTQLNDTEARVIGCLIEKSVVTPDQYPMTLNSLTNACNQKSSREPVMSLTQGEVQHTIRDLEGKHLVQTDENFKSRVEKYTQRYCNTRYSDLQFSDAELAIVCLLLLQTKMMQFDFQNPSNRYANYLSTEDNNVALIHDSGHSPRYYSNGRFRVGADIENPAEAGFSILTSREPFRGMACDVSC